MIKWGFSAASVLLCLQIGGCVSKVAGDEGSWAHFLRDPNNASVVRLTRDIAKQVSGCGWGRDQNHIAVPNDVKEHLFDLIKSGSAEGLRVGLYAERCFDGADLEDLHRSAGQYFDQDPKGFLNELMKSSASPEEYGSMLTMLPEALVDDLDGQVAAIRRRISLLQRVDDPVLADLKALGAARLRDEERLLAGVQN